jgi:hypothetical protein
VNAGLRLALLGILFVGGLYLLLGGVLYWHLADFTLEGPDQRGPYESTAIILGAIMPGAILLLCVVVGVISEGREALWPVWCSRVILVTSTYLAAGFLIFAMVAWVDSADSAQVGESAWPLLLVGSFGLAAYLSWLQLRSRRIATNSV